jgi:hypothetical protein
MSSFAERGLQALAEAWQIACNQDSPASDTPFSRLIDKVFEGQETGYKKAIIIQATGKAADISLDAQAMQKGLGDARSWDAREFAKQTFVVWNQAANEPFAHSGDPYVSNPYRIPRFDQSQRASRKRPAEFDNTLAVLEYLNAAEETAKAFANLVEVMLGLRRWIADKDVRYPLPNRISRAKCVEAIAQYLNSKSGGTRLQAIVAALFNSLASAGLKITDVTSGHINAADTASHKSGDVAYNTQEASVAAEVKDRPLSSSELMASIDKARVANVTELMFVIRAASILDRGFNESELEAVCDSQFSSGLNIYVEPFEGFSKTVLTIIGESGRRRFLEDVGTALADQNADIPHKWAWAQIVKEL